MPVELSSQQARRLSEAYVDTLVTLHQADAAALASLGRGPGYCRRQIEGWSDRYRKAKTWNVPSFESVMRWLHERMPEDSAASVIHNDFRLDNLVLDIAGSPAGTAPLRGASGSSTGALPSSLRAAGPFPVDPHAPPRIVGVLDWEMATIGDPLMDLGNALAYWVQADDGRLALATRRQPSHLPGMMTRAEIVERYFERSGIPRRDMTFYEVYGVFRLAGIVQQIYYRYHHKQTRNPAFRNFWLITHYLHRRCRSLIRRAAQG